MLGAHFNGGSGDVTEVSSLKEGEWSCYGGYHFNGGRRSSEGQKW